MSAMLSRVAGIGCSIPEERGGNTLTRLAPLGSLSRTAGEGEPAPHPNPPPQAGEGMGGGLAGEGKFLLCRVAPSCCLGLQQEPERAGGDPHGVAVADLAGEDLFGERV